MRPTLKTIAGIARVSPATVSLCLNRHPVARTLSEEPAVVVLFHIMYAVVSFTL